MAKEILLGMVKEEVIRLIETEINNSDSSVYDKGYIKGLIDMALLLEVITRQDKLDLVDKLWAE